jgi:hypothetical protein
MSQICGCYDTTVCDRFEREVKGHEAKVLMRQDGYLHMLCKKPSPQSSSYWFEIIVAPRSLTFRGDGESFVFHATEDMLGFFRSGLYGNGRIHINTTYWAEKVTSERNCLKGHDGEEFKKYALSLIDSDTEAEYPGVRAHLAKAMDECTWEHDLEDERSAREFLEGYKGPHGFEFGDVWEMDTRTYDWWFLWALHAIVWAVKEHDKLYGTPGTKDTTRDGEDITASLVNA